MAGSATADLTDLGFQPVSKPPTADLTDLGFQPVGSPQPTPSVPSGVNQPTADTPSTVAPPVRPVDAQVAELSANRARIQKDNAEPGVPFDQDSSVSEDIRKRASYEPDQKRKAHLVSQFPSVVSTRLTKDGSNVVVRTKGPDGKPVDRLLNPTSFTLGDIPGNAGEITKMAGTAALALGTEGLSLIPQALAVGVGTALQNAALVAASRKGAGQTQDLAQNLTDSAVEGAVNAAPVLAIPALEAGAKILMAPFRSGGAITGGAEAAGRQGILLSAGQRLDSGVLARTANLPGAGGKVLASDQANALRAAEGRALRGITDPVIGPAKPILSEAAIAGRTKPILAAQADPVLAATGNEVAASEASLKAADQGLKQSQTNAATATEIAAAKAREAELAATARATQQKIQSELDSGIISSSHTSSEVSDAVRQKIRDINTARVAAFEKPYAELDAEAARQGITAVNTHVQALADEVRPLINDVITRFVPGLSKIEQTSEGMKAANLSLPALRELKNQLYFMTQSGNAPGESSLMGSRLRDLAKAVDQDYKATVAQGTPEFRAAADKLTKDYAEQIAPLRQADVAKAFLGPEVPGFQGAHELVSSIFKGEGNLTALQGYKAALGADSPEYKLLLRQGLKDLADLHPVTGMIDAGEFLSKLKSLHADMRAEVLGPMEKSIFSNTELMAEAQGTRINYKTLEDALATRPAATVQDALAQQKLATGRLQTALKKQREADQIFNQKVLKDARDGTVGPQNLSNDFFVSRLVDTSDAAQARRFMTDIAARDPVLADQTRQRVLKNILDDVRTNTGTTPVTTGESTTLDFSKIKSKYLDSKEADKYRAYLGDAGMNFLRDIAQVNEVIARNALSEKGAASSASNIAAHLAGEVVPGSGGVVRAGLRLTSNIPGWFLGNAQRFQAVRDFLATGATPQFSGPIGRGVRNGLLIAPEAVRAGSGILSNKEAAPTPAPPLSQR